MIATADAASGLRVEVADDVLLVLPPDRMTEAALRLCQERMLALARETGLRRVLYDARRMTEPEAHIALMQQELDGQLGDLKLRRAIVVPGTRIVSTAMSPSSRFGANSVPRRVAIRAASAMTCSAQG